MGEWRYLLTSLDLRFSQRSSPVPSSSQLLRSQKSNKNDDADADDKNNNRTKCPGKCLAP
jgi:hypothetical protein